MNDDVRSEIRRAVHELVDATPPAPPLDDLLAFRVDVGGRARPRRAVVMGASTAAIVLVAAVFVSVVAHDPRKSVPTTPPSPSAASSTVAFGQLVPTTTPSSQPTGVTAASAHSVAYLVALGRRVSVLQALGPDAATAAAYERARANSVVSCTTAKGARTSATRPVSAASLESARAETDAFFLFDDAERAAADGYSWQTERSSASSANTGQTDPLTTDAACQADTDRALPPFEENDLALVDSQLYSEFAADVAVADVRTRWSRCMTAAGQAGYASPSALPIPGSLPKAAEIALAIADVSCRGSSGYRDAKTAWFTTRVEAWLAENLERVARAEAAVALMRSTATRG